MKSYLKAMIADSNKGLLHYMIIKNGDKNELLFTNKWVLYKF